MASKPITSTPIEPSLIARLVQGVRYVINGQIDDSWFGPQNPLPPIAQEQAVGRQFDYPVGYNLRQQPRSEEPVSFWQLRQLADNYDLMRLVIETRKDQICAIEWSISPKDDKVDPDARCDAIEAALQFPDQEHDWQTWLRALMEDLLVIDAPTIYPRLTNGNDVYALELVDGATVKRVLDTTGRTPLPPDVAYQQILKGLPAVDYSRDELVYRPRNVRTNRVYGYSPVEQVIMTVDIALRRQLYQRGKYTQGSMPDSIIGVPKEWNPDQIRQFQDYWDQLLRGNPEDRAGARFVPDGLNIHETKKDLIKDDYDEWLARIVCFAFSIAPTPFIKQMNRSTAQTGAEQALEEGLQPLMQWVATTMTYIIGKYWDAPDLCFKWDMKPVIDPLEQAQIDQIYVAAKVKTPDEVRAALGMDPLTPEQQELLNPPPPPMLPAANGDGAEAGADPPPPATKGSVVKKASDPMTTAEQELHGVVTEFLTEQGKKIAAEIAGKLGKAAADGGVDPSLTDLDLDWSSLYPKARKVLADQAEQASDSGLAAIGVDAGGDVGRAARQAAVEKAEERAAEMVGKRIDDDGNLIDNPDARWRIDEPTRDMLQSDVRDAVADGLSAKEFAAKIEDSYAFSSTRSEMIARTEIARADVLGKTASWKQSGIVTGKQWLTGADCCDECDEMNGQVVDIDDEFDGGDPPAHPNCRCTVQPVLDDDNEE